MRILSIHLRNIKSHRNREISFSAGINVLCGPNGAGKSTVFEAIGYALFGVDASEFVITRSVSFHRRTGGSTVVFQDGSGDTWKVTRGVGQPAKWLLWKEAGGAFEVEEHANAGETQTRLAELLGLDNGRKLSEQFRRVIGPFQNDFLGPFIIKRPTERQEAFDEILGIDAWRKTFKGTSTLLSAVQERGKILAAEVNLLAGQVAALPGMKEELATRQAALGSKRQELADHGAVLKDVETAIGDLDAKEASIATLRADIAKLEERIRGREKIDGDCVEGHDRRGCVKPPARKEAYDKPMWLTACVQGTDAELKDRSPLEKEAERCQQSCAQRRRKWSDRKRTEAERTSWPYPVQRCNRTKRPGCLPRNLRDCVRRRKRPRPNVPCWKGGRGDSRKAARSWLPADAPFSRSSAST